MQNDSLIGLSGASDSFPRLLSQRDCVSDVWVGVRFNDHIASVIGLSFRALDGAEAVQIKI